MLATMSNGELACFVLYAAAALALPIGMGIMEICSFVKFVWRKLRD